MQSAKQHNQIVGYFLEEAREHLETMEKCLLELQATMEDQERMNELFRAAHSLKGGAAMLGFQAIQKTAHQLEDALKLLQENPITIDQQLETLFLQELDALRELTACIEGPFGWQEDDAATILRKYEPTLKELAAHLGTLLGGEEQKEAEAASMAVSTNLFVSLATNELRQMLTLFKGPENEGTRHQIVSLCDQFITIGPNLKTWQDIVRLAQKAIDKPQNSYKTLAPVVIRDLKQAIDLIQAERAASIVPSSALEQLASSAAALPLPQDPKAVAAQLIQNFNKQQLREIAQILVMALKA